MASRTQPQIPPSQPQTPTPAEQPFNQKFFATITAYKNAAALKAAIDLDLFTAIGDGIRTPEALALRTQSSARGVRILCDFLVAEGFLAKQDGRYSLPPDTERFLNRKSPTCIASAANFLFGPMLSGYFQDLAACVREGGTAGSEGTIAPEHPIWAEFARSMAPIAALNAELVAPLLGAGRMQSCKVLDIAAGHGMYGIALARHNPKAEIVALDWKHVLPVARENAAKANVSLRYRTIEGSAFDADFGEGYDLVLLTNFLHHFNPETIETLLRKVHRALKPDGRALALEFVPNSDRVTPSLQAEFALIMLATTPDGDAYTFEEFDRMFRGAGFRSVELHEIPPALERVVIGNK
jgi:2-polyprenyl-3-methyl-5-hydroxy-6-metoxy-1,4-benzoquinol methylase